MRVMVVEDEEPMATGLRVGLEAEGFAVDVAPNGVEALWLAGERTYDAVILDLMLPGMSGHEICRRMRKAEIWTPILILTARDDERDEVKALDTGADDYLTKPFSFPVLLAHLRSLMRRGAHERPAILTAQGIRLDPASRRAWHGRTEVFLTAREVALLEFLLRRRGEVVSKRQILDHVWGTDFEGDPNIVEVYIGHLRNKLDRPFGSDAVETVRGVGYRIRRDDD
jgi:two-component system, OmpR family, response regulator